ncbi:MAG: hypothetical protein PHY93_13740 [Bacteriovorax sp.]|nr:hypothetical protein [Bacteriovorax sp.]
MLNSFSVFASGVNWTSIKARRAGYDFEVMSLRRESANSLASN